MKQSQMYSVFALAFVVAVGCRGGGDGDNGENGENGNNGGGGPEQQIQDVQDDRLPVGTQVILNDVVVTAVDRFGERQQTLYVQEPAGGQRSGIAVFSRNIPADIAVGDIVDVTGSKDEFALDSDMSGQTVTQIENATITKTGTGEPLAPEVLDPWILADPIQAEAWEGVLVRFDNVKVERMPFADDPEDEQDMTITGPFNVRSELAAFPAGIGFQDCFVSVTGVIDYFFDYRMLNRSTDDITTGGSDCLPEEDGSVAEAVCGDGMDNDRDGFADCSDFFCYGIGSCGVDSDVVSVQDDSVELNELVIVTGVVTAINRDRNGVWIMDEGVGAADHNGVQVRQFGALGEIAGGIERGSELTVTGVKRDSFGSTSIANARIEDTGGDGAVAVRDNVGPDLVSNPTSGKVLEGQLVAFDNLEVVSNTIGFGQFSVASGGDQDLVIDDTLFTYELPNPGDCVTSITGVILLNTFDDFYYVAPRDAADLNVTAGACD